MTRLLKTPIVARAGTASISSCIDRLGGESMACTLRMPPDFCAKLGTMPNADTTSAAAVNARRPDTFPDSSLCSLRSAARFFGLLRNACDDSLSPIILAAQRDGWVFSETKDDRHEPTRAHARVDWKNSLSMVPSRFVLESDWRGLRLDEDTWSGSKVNRLIGEFLRQALPSIDLAQGDLT